MGVALHTGSRPLFFNSPPFREPFFPYPDLTPLLNLREQSDTSSSSHDGSAVLLLLVSDMDDELARAWGVMSEFCALINFAADSGQRIATTTYLDTMASVVYRLLDMHFDTGSSDEAVRLGLLVFSCDVFLQWRRLGMPYSHLTSAFRECLTGPALPRVSPQLLLWLLAVGAIAAFDAADNAWLRPLLIDNMSLCGIDTWVQMRDLMRSFLWIGLLHDKPGKGVFDTAMAGEGSSPLNVSHVS